MPNAFQQAQTVEEESWAILEPFIQMRSFDGRWVKTAKGKLARELQRTVGDVLMNTDDESIRGIEIKAEEDKTGNFFLETWSNRKRFTLGWMYTLNADFLFYHFLKDDELYIMNFDRLREWAFWNGGPIYRYKEARQRKYSQLNDTWGRCVPITIIQKAMPVKLFHPELSLRFSDAT